MDLSLNGELSELSRLAGAIERFCADNHIAEDPQFQLTLALDELFSNAIRHGGCRGIAGAVAIRLEPSEHAVHVDYRDLGAPFDPLSASPPDLTLPLEQRAAGGLGIHFVRQMMRRLQYDRCGDWNRLTMELPL